MNKFENVKFDEIKNLMIEIILDRAKDSILFWKNILLTDRLTFYNVIDVRTTISFFSDDMHYLNKTEQIIYKPLTIEDILYRSFEEILTDCKKWITSNLNEMEQKYNLNFYNLSIFLGTHADFVSREAYFKHIGNNIKNA